MENTQFSRPKAVPYNDSWEIPNSDYILLYLNDKQTGKITCMVCGKEGHYTCECPMKNKEKYVICTLCGKVGHCHLWCCHQNESERRACRRCGEKGHYDNWHHLGCSSCEKHHPLGRCPMGKITCFLCEGNGHVPVQCHLSPMLTAITQNQRESFRATLRQALRETSNTAVTPITLTRELEPYNDKNGGQPKGDNEMVPRVLGFNQGEEGHSALRNPNRCHVPSSDKANVAADKAPNQSLGVTCFNCEGKGHYSNKCPQKQKQHGVRSTNAAAMKDKTPNLTGVTCFDCGDRGHFSYTCPQNLLEVMLTAELEPHDDTYERQPKADNGTVPTVLSLNCGEASHCGRNNPMKSLGSSSDKINSTAMTYKAPKRVLGVICFNCHEEGHYANRCPQKQQGINSGTSQSPIKRQRKE
ncbi:uncharacterized protein LOC127755171 [Oryza glaberrima]|uniref:CCHC-type domain-containing protein n=1 Tax=Oryza glaberrima TaxID=4538 RepID=I1QZG4_ORYGL|nr:uncharacterized protein LOC127755171 [Oryza glaberrima]XP_052136790.1 uncharacterized protein LOC127755171 [Oryza glaberrima]XP_052136791.1 uncharacterized protein LOC127755171 [Oryza glaberrima]